MGHITSSNRWIDRNRPDDKLTILENTLFWLFVLTMVLTGVSFTSDRAVAQDGEDRLNVVLVMTDDQGYGDLGYYGNETVRTPHMDRLAENSVRLEDFHVATYCSPTRAALLTGRLPVRTGVTSTNHLRNNLPSREVLMSEFFQASGYRTAIFGKWHLGDTYPFRPIDRGFDEWLGLGMADWQQLLIIGETIA